MKKAYLGRAAALETAALLAGGGALALLLYLLPEPADLTACAIGTPLLMGGSGGFYLGGKCSPRWVRAALAAACAGLLLLTALLASLTPFLLTAGTLLRAGGLVFAAALLGALFGAGRREARRLAGKAEDRAGESPAVKNA